MSQTRIKAAKRQALRVLNRLCWPVLFLRFRKSVFAGRLPSDRLLALLVYHWGNAGWSADARYLRRLLQETMSTTNQTILELGSGLTTVLLGVVADRQSHRVLSLEHHAGWQQRVTSTLSRNRIQGARVFHSALRDYGRFDWYDISSCELPGDIMFDMVICDGPPSQTRGGRFGLPYVMNSQFKPGCMIIADDAHRPGEQEIFARWAEDFPIRSDESRSEAHFITFIFDSPLRDAAV